MKVQLTQAEIERGVESYLRRMMPALAADVTFRYSFTAGRGGNGLTADVDMLTPEDLEAEANAPQAAPAPAATAPAISLTPKPVLGRPRNPVAAVVAPEPEQEVAQNTTEPEADDKQVDVEPVQQQAEPEAAEVEPEQAVVEQPAPVVTPKRTMLFGQKKVAP